MDKFNFHESLRIYLPGLLLTSISYFLIEKSLKGIEVVLIPSIFIGLLLNGLIWQLHIPVFRKLAKKKYYQIGLNNVNYFEGLDKIIKLKIRAVDTQKEFDTILNAQNHILLSSAEVSFFAKKYDSPELNCFRSPKSFGIMYYNLSLVCLLTCLFMAFFILKGLLFPPPITQFGHLILLATASLLSWAIFRRNSIHFFKRSLNRELDYWKSLSASETLEYMEILKLLTNLEVE